MHYIHLSPFIATIKSQENNDEVAKTTRWLLKMVFYIKENEGVSVFLNLKLDILNKLWSFSVDGNMVIGQNSINVLLVVEEEPRGKQEHVTTQLLHLVEEPVKGQVSWHSLVILIIAQVFYLRLFKYCSFPYTLSWNFERFYTVNILTLQRCCSEFCILFLICKKP